MTFEDAAVLLFCFASGAIGGVLLAVTAPVWMPVVAAAAATVAAAASAAMAAAAAATGAVVAAAGTAVAVAGTVAHGAAAMAGTAANGAAAFAATEPGRKLIGKAAPILGEFLGRAVAGEAGAAVGLAAGEVVSETV